MKTGPLVMAMAAASISCAPVGNVTEVSPEELPVLEAQIAQRPGDGDLILRYAAGLYAANQCDSAMTVAARGMQISPANAIGPLVIGPCLEDQERYDDAVATYARFAAENPRADGLSAVRARELLARRSAAKQFAAAALRTEDSLSPPNPQVIAVLPLAIAGDSMYAPLSRGLAQMIMSDLGLLRTFRMVERLQLGALLDELQLDPSRVAPQTAARLGRLVSAGRLVQGLANIPDEENVTLEGSVLRSDGSVTSPHVVRGRFRDLIQMEKELVTVMAVRLGYQLSEAERQLILENGTQNLVAFLAYSRGLEAQELEDYAAASVHFGNAVQADPNFQEARTRQEASQTAPRVQAAPRAAVGLASSPSVGGADAGPVTDAAAGAVQGALGDLAATHTEKTTESAGGTTNVASKNSSQTTASEPPPPDLTQPPVTTTIRIVFRLP